MCTCARTCMCALTNTSIYTTILLKFVAVSKLQVAILARSSRETSQTVRNFCIREKHTKHGGNRVALVCVYLNEQRRPLSPAERAVTTVTVGRHRPIEQRKPERHRGVCVCVRVCARVCMRACVMCLQYTILIFDQG